MSLRSRMVTAGWLMVLAGVVSFIGFLVVAVGLAGAGYLSELIPWRVALIGFGVMLGYFGAAVKGPSLEWQEVPPEPPMESDVGARPSGSRYACPGCGGDVYAGQATCPECGYTLPGARIPPG